ncbi:MAG TPA: VPLPA-CTERM sorting domain-containing protein [Steroidobacteraceae bacterium]|nr:VPLPA-CTERM sorting domain-containing protein [Steroidobacteraceae bacterium]
MNTFVRLAVATALAAGGSAALAQTPPANPNLPSSGNADLWLFVSNGTSETFAEDTGISIDSLVPSTWTAGGNLQTPDPQSISLHASTALSSFLSSTGTSGLEWTVEAVQYPTGTGTTASANEPAGKEVGLFASQLGEGGLSYGALGGWATGFNNDVTYMAQNGYAAGGATYLWSNGTTVGNVWGPGGDTSQPGSVNEYGEGPDTSGIGLGTAAADQETLYLVTGNGNKGTAQSYVLSTQLELTTTGTLETPPVPVPAAVWLFGSGLLGLVGVGRRRANAA